MKTRIKAVTDGNGDTTYYPQFKFLFWWMHFKQSGGYYSGAERVVRVEFLSVESCRRFIHLRVEEYLEKKVKNKVRVVKYIGKEDWE